MKNIEKKNAYPIPPLYLHAVVLAGALSVLPELLYAADAGNGDIIKGATESVKDFLKNDMRKVIDLSLLSAGAFFGAMRGSWTPVVGGGLGVALYEVLIKAIG